MGFNYQKRGRGEDLNVADPMLGYTLSNDNLEFEKFDVQQVTDRVNKKLDEASEKLKRKFSGD